MASHISKYHPKTAINAPVKPAGAKRPAAAPPGGSQQKKTPVAMKAPAPIKKGKK